MCDDYGIAVIVFFFVQFEESHLYLHLEELRIVVTGSITMLSSSCLVLKHCTLIGSPRSVYA